jgi:hypothetical protein
MTPFHRRRPPDNHFEVLIMAITLTTLRSVGKSWAVHGYSADATGNETLVAAVTGKSHWIKKIAIHCITATTVTINQDTTLVLGPFNFLTTVSTPFVYEFTEPIRLTAGTAIKVDAGGAGAVNVIIEGFTDL